MGKKTILRLEDGINLDEVQLHNLKQIIGDDCVLQQASLTADMHRSYQLRAESLANAFRLIVKSVPRKSTESFDSDSYLSWVNKQYSFAKDLTLEGYEETLKNYTAKLLEALVAHWITKSNSEHLRWLEAIDLLNKSEQYYLMMNGRPNLATLTRGEIYEEKNFILQWDRQLNPFTEETLSELGKIKANYSSGTPEWFRNLPLHQQVYFHNLSPGVFTVEMLKIQVNDFILQWNSIKKDKDIANDLVKIKNNSVETPSWFASLSPACGAFVAAVLKASTNNLEGDMSNSLNAMNQMLEEMQSGKQANWIPHLAQVRELPFWFLCLPTYEQQLLKYVLKSSKKMEDVTSFLASRLRTVPGVPNFCTHGLAVLNSKCLPVKEFSDRLRSSHAGSREVKKYPDQVSRLHTQRNIDRISQEARGKTILVQTLISPVPYSDRFIPDTYLEEQRLRAVNALRQRRGKEVRVLTSNHPLNVARYALWTSSSDAECNDILAAARNFYKPHVIEKAVQSLNLQSQEAKALIALINESLSFINNSQKPNDYYLLCKQANQLDLSQVNLSVSEFQDLLKKAKDESNSLLITKQIPAPAPTPPTEAAHVKQALVNMFYSNKDSLTWDNCETLFAQLLHWNSLKKRKDAALLLKEITDLALLTNEYDVTLKSNWGTATFRDYNGRELYLSSLENLLVIHMQGSSYGSCVSGKDRKAIELIHTDAMLLYREKYGYWPSYRDVGVERSNFVDLVADLYLSRHAHEHAGQNAPGSEGVKTPMVYFPADIAEAISRKSGLNDILKRDDCIASNNEVKHIVQGTRLVDEKTPSYIEAAKRLSEKDRNAFLDKLKAITGERTFWESKAVSYTWWSNTPKGIARMAQILDKFPSSNSIHSETVLAEIYKVVCERPTTNKSRDPITQEIYGLIIRLFVSTKPELIIGEALKTLDTIKNQSFTLNTESTLKM